MNQLVCGICDNEIFTTHEYFVLEVDGMETRACEICYNEFKENGDKPMERKKCFEEKKYDGKQTDIGVSFRDYIASAVLECARVEKEGADKYGRDNWYKVSIEDSIEHAVTHLFKALVMKYDIKDDYIEEVVHACCRCMMAIALEKREK